MRILLTASSRHKAKNYRRYLGGIGRVDILAVGEHIDGINLYDMLVLSGGEDIEPSRYNEEVKYPSVKINRERDEMEFNLVDKFVKSKKPIFGICRGFQLLVVYFGGSLFQDLESEGFKSHRGKDGGDTYHRVRLCGILRDGFGDEWVVNSNHHQGLKDFPGRLPDGEILAISEDNIVEAFMSRKFRIFAVQWHPERHKGEGAELSTKLLDIIRQI